MAAAVIVLGMCVSVLLLAALIRINPPDADEDEHRARLNPKQEY